MGEVDERQPPAICDLADIPKSILRFGRAPVACPLDTLATRDVAAGCSGGGWPADLDWPLQQLELGPVEYSLVTTNLILLVFENLTAVPMTWLDVPQMYWVSWGKITATTMIIIGAVFTSLGGLSTLLGIACIIFL
jgi:hypothetical protein